MWIGLWARCEEIVQFRRNYAQDFWLLRQFNVVAHCHSREHLLARESAGLRRCGPLPRASARRRSSLEGRELSGSWSIRDAAVFGEASASSGLAKPAFGPTAARCSGPRAGDRPGPRGVPSGTFCRSGGAPAAVRGRTASSGAARPAPEDRLPCRSWLSEGRCRSNVDHHLSGRGRFPSSASGSWPIRDRAGSARTLREGLDRPRKAPARVPGAAREAASQEAACRRP
jgi:hypothetical protein